MIIRLRNLLCFIQWRYPLNRTGFQAVNVCLILFLLFIIVESLDADTRESDAHGKDHSMNYKLMKLTVPTLRKQEVTSLTPSQP